MTQVSCILRSMLMQTLPARRQMLSQHLAESGRYLVLAGPNSFFPLAWLSKRQTSVSRSTTESEIVSLAHSLYQEGLPALSLWSELLGRHDLKLVIHEDNQATILVAKKGYSPKLRHISRTHKVNLGCISEQVAEGTHISIQYVDTAEQAADIFTKARRSFSRKPRVQPMAH